MGDTKKELNDNQLNNTGDTKKKLDDNQLNAAGGYVFNAGQALRKNLMKL